MDYLVNFHQNPDPTLEWRVVQAVILLRPEFPQVPPACSDHSFIKGTINFVCCTPSDWHTAYPALPSADIAEAADIATRDT